MTPLHSSLVTLGLVIVLMLLLPLITLCVRSMDQVNFDCSLKSIPIPSAKEYLSELIHSTAKFAANLSWKVYWFLNPLDFEKKFIRSLTL